MPSKKGASRSVSSLLLVGLLVFSATPLLAQPMPERFEARAGVISLVGAFFDAVLDWLGGQSSDSSAAIDPDGVPVVVNPSAATLPSPAPAVH